MTTSNSVRSSTSKNLAVFIDADNVNDPTALDHVLQAVRTMADRVLYRRAYGRPESLKGIEAVLWRHGVRPVANLIVDKVTTDSALLIDAVEAVCTNEIDTVAICSGDADFVPLAIWLREKGCWVVCYSLANKIFANAESFYDEVVLIDVVETPRLDVSSTPVPVPVPASKSTVLSSAVVGIKTPLFVDAGVSIAAVGLKKTTSVKPEVSSYPSMKQILNVLPELRHSKEMHLSQAARKLRDSGLLAKNASSTTLFRRYAGQFELIPAKQPNMIRYRGG